MKNHRFPWLRNRTTDNRKCEKARNIKEKRTIEMFMLDLFRYIGCNCVRSSFGGALWTIYLVRMLFLTSQM